MRAAEPPLLPILRSAVVGKLIALLAMDVERWWTLDEIAAGVGGAYPTVSREVRRLQQVRLVEVDEMGRTKRVRLDTSNPLHSPLAELMIRSFGPVVVIGEEFGALDSVTQVSIYGSWAARYSGEQGPTPNDIDVLVLGRPDRDEIYEAARRSERRLGVAVNTTIRTPEDWSRAEDSFTRQVKTSPMVTAWPREEVG